MDVFTAYLKSKTPLLEKEIARIRSAATLLRIKRKEFLLKQGETCRGYAFVCKGCFRMYRPGVDGAQHILRFAIENWWICELESIDLGQPSKNAIQALEASEILFWEKDAFDALCHDLPAFGALCRQLTTRNQHVNLQRIFANLSFTAEEKYQDFLTTYPEIFNRVPLHMIASYLGMTRKTISRIRGGHRV